MTEALKTGQTWITFAGCILVVAVLYWAQAILVPVALAVLITFVLTPAVLGLQRWIGRGPAVLLVVGVVFLGLGAATWGFARQLTALAVDLPQYRSNIRQKAADVRLAVRGAAVETVQKTLKDIEAEITKGEKRGGTAAAPVVVQSEQVVGLWGFPAWLGQAAGPLATGGLVIAMVIFMLLEREDLRSRIIRLVGHGHLAVTTKAIDEAGQRVSRQLLLQTLVNLIYGLGVGIGLWAIGVPYALLWAALAAALRFIPYLGPIAAAAGPILVALAALPGWTRPLSVMALFVGLELFTNLVLETIWYAGAAGVSQVALLVAVAFWTWLWGPMGLLLATPLTVCLVVLGRHVKGLEFLATLMADAPALPPDIRYYQRLLARDQSEASELVEHHLGTESPDTVYDALLLPALNYAERDRLEGRLSVDEETLVVEATRELMADVAGARRAAAPGHGDSLPESGDGTVDDTPTSATPVSVLGYATNGIADEVALHMLHELLADSGVALDVVSNRAMSSEVVATIQEGGYRILCMADLPPSPPSKTRYLIKKLRAALPDIKIVVGRWAPPPLADETAGPLLEAGAQHVAATLTETRHQLEDLARALSPIAEASASPPRADTA